MTTQAAIVGGTSVRGRTIALKTITNWVFYAFLLLAPYRSSMWLTGFWSVQKLVGACLLGLAAWLWLRGELRVPMPVYWLTVGLLSARLIGSLSATAFMGHSFNGPAFVTWIQCLLLVVITAGLVQNRQSLGRVLAVSLISVAIACSVYLVEYKVVSEILYSQGWNSDAPIRELGITASSQDEGLFMKREDDSNAQLGFQIGSVGNPVAFTLTLLALLPVNFYFLRAYLQSGQRLKSGLAGIALLLNLSVTLLTYSRAALLISLVMLVLLVSRDKKYRLKFTIIALVLGLGAIAVLYQMDALPAMKTRLQQATNLLTLNFRADDSGQMRAAVQRTALTLAFKNPLFGIGLDNFRTEEVRYSGLGVYQSAENLYLQIFAEGGAFYFLLSLLLVGWCLRRLVWGRRLDPFYGPALKLAWVAMLLMSATIYTEKEYFFNVFAGLLFNYGLCDIYQPNPATVRSSHAQRNPLSTDEIGQTDST